MSIIAHLRAATRHLLSTGVGHEPDTSDTRAKMSATASARSYDDADIEALARVVGLRVQEAR